MDLQDLFESSIDELLTSIKGGAPIPLWEKDAPKAIPVQSMKYGTWEIKYRTKPASNGLFTAYGYHDRQGQLKAEGSSAQEVLQNIKSQIDDMSLSHDVKQFSHATIDYNAEFSRECIEHGPTGVRLVKGSDGVYLIVCGEEYLDAFGNEVYGTGEDRFTRLFHRKAAPQDGNAASLFSSAITPKQINDLGLRPFARYALEYDHKDMDYGHRYYKLVFDSHTLNKDDKRRLHAPGLTVAVF